MCNAKQYCISYQFIVSCVAIFKDKPFERSDFSTAPNWNWIVTKRWHHNFIQFEKYSCSIHFVEQQYFMLYRRYSRLWLVETSNYCPYNHGNQCLRCIKSLNKGIMESDSPLVAVSNFIFLLYFVFIAFLSHVVVTKYMRIENRHLHGLIANWNLNWWLITKWIF